jgi:hypothetical protein
MNNNYKAKIKQMVMQGLTNEEIVSASSRDKWDVIGREMYYFMEKVRTTLANTKDKPVTRLAKTEPYHEDEMDYGKPYEFTGSFSVSETMILNKLNKGFVYEDKRKLSSFERKLNGDRHKYSSNKLV